MTEASFLSEVTLPRHSISAFLAKWARDPVTIEAHKEGRIPYIFVAPPPFIHDHEDESAFGWVMLEWVFNHPIGLLRYRAYLPFNTEADEFLCVIDEKHTPSQQDYCTVLQRSTFLTDLESLFRDHPWLHQRDPRMKSRQIVPKTFHSNHWAMMPFDSQITHESQKLACSLVKETFLTMIEAPEKDMEEFIALSDEVLAPVYMPSATNASFVADLKLSTPR